MNKFIFGSFFVAIFLLTLLISTPTFADDSLIITNFEVSEYVISPNSDGIKDTTSIDIAFSEEVSAEINILDSNKNIIKNLYRSPSVTNPRSKFWDGKDELDQVVLDGIYIIQIIGTSTLSGIVNDTSKTITVHIIAPEITLNGESSVRIRRGSQYTELGAKANDNIDGEFNASSSSNVDTNTRGTYTVTYTAIDSAGNIAKEVTRTVVVYSSGRRRTPVNEPVPEVLGDQTGPTENQSTSTVETSTTTTKTEENGPTTSSTTGEVLGVEIYKFNNNLGFGLRNNDVLELQKRLKSEGLFTASTTGYFGTSTKDAVIKYQEKYASEILTPLGLTKGTGFVGQYTRAKLNQ